jgi:hypothetical protein
VVPIIASGTAWAEGSFTSSLTRVETDFNSRTWTDNHTDANNTVITLKGCRRDYPSETKVTATLQLTHETPWYEPDQNQGQKVFPCYSSSTQGYGTQTKTGGYHFTVVDIDGCGSCGYYISTSSGGVAVSY